jgi:hypothetical protein
MTPIGVRRTPVGVVTFLQSACMLTRYAHSMSSAQTVLRQCAHCSDSVLRQCAQTAVCSVSSDSVSELRKCVHTLCSQYAQTVCSYNVLTRCSLLSQCIHIVCSYRCRLQCLHSVLTAHTVSLHIVLTMCSNIVLTVLTAHTDTVSSYSLLSVLMCYVLDTLGPFGQDSPNMDTSGPFGQTKPTMDTMGQLGQDRPKYGQWTLWVHLDRLGLLWTLWVHLDRLGPLLHYENYGSIGTG